MRRLPLTLRLGLAAMLLGAAPLLLFLAVNQAGMIADPNPNPIGLGLLCAAGMMVGQPLCLIGLVSMAFRRFAA